MVWRRAAIAGMVLMVLAVLAMAWTYSEDFEGAVTPNPPAGWQVVPPVGRNLWKTVSSEELSAEPAASGFTKALYFGDPQPDHTGSYKRARVANNDIMTPDLWDSGLRAGDYVVVKFSYYRQVEQGAPGFDNTDVILEFQDRRRVIISDVTIFHKDSGDPLGTGWQEFISDPIQVPPGTRHAYVLFRFNPRDRFYNDYLGWLIDDLVVMNVPYIDTPSSSSLPSGAVGKPYLKPDGRLVVVDAVADRSRPYSWSVEGLPVGLRMRQYDYDGDGYDEAIIEGTPEQAGTFPVKVTVTDGDGVKYEKTFTLTITGGESGVITENFDNCLPSSWKANGLWNCTNVVMHEGINVVTPEYGNVMYFGDPTTFNYDTGSRVKGKLESPQYDVKRHRGKAVKLTFDYWRDVEDYPAGSVDRTWVEYIFNTGEKLTVWFKDSTDQSSAQWATATIEDVDGKPIVVPSNASWMKVIFHFDSVDGINNDHTGWLVDNFRLEFVTLGLKITSESQLPDAEMNRPYSFQFQAVGGQPPYRWEASRELPKGLDLDPTTGKLTGMPTDFAEIGPHLFTVTVTDRTGRSVSKNFQLKITRQMTLFADDFDTNLGNWDKPTGLWHLTGDVKGVSGIQGKAAYYGKDDIVDPNYATGSRTEGALVSKPFDVTGQSAFKLSFRYWREVEYYSNGGYDETYVQVRFKTASGWSDWYTIWEKDCSDTSAKSWEEAEVGPYTIPVGATQMKIKFVFDSVDQHYNDYVGWLIDDVKVSIAESGSPLRTTSVKVMSQPRGEVTFFNYPNPVTDVHTTTFGVRGIQADKIKVQVFDLAGRLVWEGEAAGNELSWHTDDLLGQYLANGVYFYVIYVQVGNTWIHSPIQKLAIYR